MDMEGSERPWKLLDTLMEAEASGPGTDLPGVRDTAYGALQAVTYVMDHQSTTRATTCRMNRLCFDSAVMKTKERALEYAN